MASSPTQLDGQSLFRRLAAQNFAGLRTRRRIGSTGSATLSGQSELCEKDSATVAAYGKDGAGSPSSRSQAQIYRADSPATAPVVGAAARLNPGRTTRSTPPASRTRGEFAFAVDGAAENGHAAEKKSLHAQERDTEANRRRRQAFQETVSTIPADKLIFLDESGVTTQMTRFRGRAPRGTRVPEATPQGHWQVLTTLGALALRGIVGAMTVESATDGDVFLAYLEHVLCPKLQPGDVVVMDNLSAHKVDGVRGLVTARGAKLLYLPPYSPDFNPIEQCWSKIKQILRTLKARTAEALEQAVAQALAAITAENARGWFAHCGYGIHN